MHSSRSKQRLRSPNYTKVMQHAQQSASVLSMPEIVVSAAKKLWSISHEYVLRRCASKMIPEQKKQNNAGSYSLHSVAIPVAVTVSKTFNIVGSQGFAGNRKDYRFWTERFEHKLPAHKIKSYAHYNRKCLYVYRELELSQFDTSDFIDFDTNLTCSVKEIIVADSCWK